MVNLEALENIDMKALAKLPKEQREYIKEKLKGIKDYYRFNRLVTFEPYDYQRDFIAAGKTHQVRYLRAGNRTGKTYGAAAEFAYHITGLYPADWNGARIEGSGHTFWAVGITLDSVATVIQKELFGTADIRTEDLGTGTIPKDKIVKDQGWQPDGGRLRSCMIRHKSGGLNTLRFYGSENVAVMMGAKCALIWMDEEALNGMEVYTQCVTRLINALGPGKNGYLMFTATPERGYTELNKLFDNDESGLLYLRSASWDECPHFTPEMIEQELAKYPTWQHEMRRRGLPVLGTGAIFEIEDNAIKLMELNIPDNWEILAAIDWGEQVDPTVVTVAVRNPQSDHYYIYDVLYFDTDRSPHAVGRALNERYPGITLIRPHDRPALSNQLINMGVNVQFDPFRNPPSSVLKMKQGNGESKAFNDVETGLDEMRLMFSEGRLKVLSRCEKWFEQKATYYYKQNKNTGKVDRSRPDDLMDSSRYAILSLMANRGMRYGDLVSGNSFTQEDSPELFY